MKKNKKSKKKNHNILIISIVLIILSIITIGLSIFLVNKRQKELEEVARLEELNRKYPLVAEDFEEGLLEDYTLLGCDIENDTLTFYLNNISEDNYTKLCKNIVTIMDNFKEKKENCSQTNIKFYIYNNNITNYKNEKEKILIDFNINENKYQTIEEQKLPTIEHSEGLLEYKFISFDGEILEISMNLSSLNLYEKVGQMKTFYEVAKSMNENIVDLTLKIVDNNLIYIYNNTDTITIIETIEL